jgi:hypothetical protein
MRKRSFQDWLRAIENRKEAEIAQANAKFVADREGKEQGKKKQRQTKRHRMRLSL